VAAINLSAGRERPDMSQKLKIVNRENAMRTTACVTAIVLAAVTSLRGDEKKFDAGKLVGTWNYVSGEKAGEKLDADHFKGQTVVVTKETITLKSEMGSFVIKYELDAKKTPVAAKLEITDGPFAKGEKADAIIELSGDELKICYVPGGPTPTKFDAGKDSKAHLFVLKRSK
jgi:uncharacterized protein (TIGR03067 family)